MSIVQNQSILLGEFSGLNEENKRLRGQIIEITLEQEKMIEENRRLEDELKRKEKEVVECRLREKNLQHSLQHVNNLYTTLQHTHNTTLTLTTCQNHLQLRTLYKKQTQLALDLAFIQRQSYRQAKKSKTHQLQLYQQRIVSLLSENDKLNGMILDMTNEYNEKIRELKRKVEESEGRVRRVVEVEARLKGVEGNGAKESGFADIAVLQLQLKLQNTQQKLHLYIQQNTELRRRNLTLVQQNDSLLQQITHSKRREKQMKKQQKQQEMNMQSKNNNNNKEVDRRDCSIECMQAMMEENYKLKKQLEQIKQKYTLLAETYPKLVQDYANIQQLQANTQKLTTITQLQQQLAQAHTLQSALTQTLNKLQSKYLAQLKARESAEYKCSILTKRFNEIFIKMNPYFNIYQYQALELNQEELAFFNANKDYRLLKEYEREVGQMRRELKEEGYWRDKEARENGDRLAKKETELTKLKQQLTTLQSQLTTLNTTNTHLTSQLHNYQLLNINPQLLNQTVNEHKLNNEVTLPLLEKMVDKLQLEREHLLEAIYQKDAKIVELARELREVVRVEVVEGERYKSNRQDGIKTAHNTGYQQLNILITKNEQLQQKYDSTVHQLTTLIHNLQSQLSTQHDIYQAQTKQYQEEYTRQFMEMREMVEKWKENCGKFKALFLEGKKRESMVEQQEVDNREQHADQQQAMNDIHAQPQHPQPHQHPEITPNTAAQLLLLQPHYTNLPSLSQQSNSNNKLIGQSTVQNLTIMLKKYEQEMNEVLTMCAKLTDEYNQLKQKVRSQEQMREANVELMIKCNELTEQISQLKLTLQQKNLSLQTTQTLYLQKHSQLQHLQSSILTQSHRTQSIIQQQRQKNHLLSKQLSEIKEKIYGQLIGSSESAANEQMMNNGEFEAIVVMHANKNKEISHLVETNKALQAKVDALMNQLNHLKQLQVNKKSEEVSPLERSEIKQLNLLLKTTNLLDLIKKANDIVQKQQRIELEQQQQQNEMVEQGKIGQQQEREVQDKDKSLEY